MKEIDNTQSEAPKFNLAARLQELFPGSVKPEEAILAALTAKTLKLRRGPL